MSGATPLRRLLSRPSYTAPYRIAGIPYPERAETQHTIVSGTTGSGKTVLISDLVAQIRGRGERCVVYDKMGSYTRAFLDPARDVLMNPLDARAPRWSPFFEARSPRDFDMMAAALNAAETRLRDPETGRMMRTGDQKAVIATFRHDTSRNLDPQIHTHAVLANMVRGEDGKWRTMANEALYSRQKLIGMVYRSELAQGLARLEAVTGERIAALEGIGELPHKAAEPAPDAGKARDRAAEPAIERDRAPKSLDRGMEM